MSVSSSHEPSAARGRSHIPLFAFSMVAAIINFGVPLILVRLLSTDEIGRYKTFFLYLAFVPTLSFAPGLMSGLAYWAGHGQRGREIIRASGALILAGALVLSLLAALLSPMLQGHFAWSHSLAAAFAAAMLGTIAGTYFEEACIVRGRVLLGALFYSGFEIVRAIAMVSTAFLWGNLEGVVTAHVIVSVLKVGVSYWLEFLSEPSRLHISRAAFSAAISYAWPVALAAVFAFISTSSDQLVLSYTLSPAEFALYALGCLSLSPLFLFEQSVTRVLVPQLSSAFASGDSARAAQLHRDGCSHLALVLVPSAALLIVFAEPLMVLLFTENFRAAAPYLQIFAVTYVLMILPQDVVARARGQSSWILRAFIISAFASVVLTLSLAAAFGSLGALAALLLTRCLMRAMTITYVKRVTGWALRQFIPCYVLAALCLACFVIAIACILIRPLFSSELLWMAGGGFIFALCYLPCAMAVERSLTFDVQTPRKIIIVLPTLATGGIERMVLNLALEYQRKGEIKPIIFAYDDQGSGEIHALLREAGIRVTAFRKGEGFSLAVVGRLLALVIREKAYIIHSHTLGALMYACLAQVLSFGLVRIFHTQHSFIHLSERSRDWWYERIFSLFPHRIIVVSESLIPAYESLGVRRERILVIPNGLAFVEPPISRRADRIAMRRQILRDGHLGGWQPIEPDLSDVWVLYLARLHAGKGHENALRIWNSLSVEVRTRAHLIFIGPETEPGRLAELHDRMAEARNPERVHYLGATSQPERWMRAADALVSYSTFEGHPLTPLEALGVATPVLLSNIPGHMFLKDIAWLDSHSGDVTVHSESIRLFEDLVRRCLSTENPDQRTVSASHWVREQFSLSRMVERYEQVFLRKDLLTAIL